MNAVISGQLGIAFLLNGNDIRSVSIDDVSNIQESSWSDFAWVINDAPDMLRLSNVNDEVVIEQLTEAWEFDRCLQLIFVLFDQGEKRSIKDAAAEIADQFLGHSKTYERVISRFFSSQIPEPKLFAPGWLYAEEHLNIGNLLTQVEKAGQAIQELTNAWDEIPVSLFGSARGKLEQKELLIQHNVFLLFANALDDRKVFDRELFECRILLQDFSNYREVLNIWLNDLTPAKKMVRENMESETDFGEETKSIKRKQTSRQRHRDKSETVVPSHQIFEMVKEKKQPIFDLIDNGDSDNAIALAKTLLQFQMNNGGSYYASKSLCDFAQRAKTNHLLNLQNNFCQLAVDVLPNDGWSHGQLADSFLCLSRFNEAMTSFKKCLELGEDAFGATGIARIHRIKGDLDKSLELFEKAQADYPGDPSPTLGRAEVLRGLRRWEESLEEYRQCTVSFPQECVGFCGLAAVLTDLGKFEEARKVYNRVTELFGENPVALSGIADTFAKEERYAEAIKAYDKAIDQFPNAVVPIAGRANVLRSDKQYELAKKEFEFALKRFDNEPMFLSGLAEVYRANGELCEAEQIFDEAIEKYPFEAWGWVGKANSLKSRRQYQEAMTWFDKAVFQFPYNFHALSGRADVFKCFGEFDNAVQAYERLGKITNDRCSFVPAIAAIRGSQKQYNVALDLLGDMPIEAANTQSDWIANHVYAMILLRKGDLDQAERVFQSGVDNCSWSKERRYFVSGLAMVKLRKGNLKDAAALVRRPDTVFEHILSFQINSASGNQDRTQSSREYVKQNCPPVLVELRDGLFKSSASNGLSDELFDQICMGGLLRLAA